MPSKHFKVLIWTFFILSVYALSLISLKEHLPEQVANQWTLRHILAFCVFVILSKLAFPGWSYLKIAIIAFSFGLFIEISQELFTGGRRNFHLSDIINNTIGIICGLIILFYFSKKK